MTEHWHTQTSTFLLYAFMYIHWNQSSYLCLQCRISIRSFEFSFYLVFVTFLCKREMCHLLHCINLLILSNLWRICSSITPYPYITLLWVSPKSDKVPKRLSGCYFCLVPWTPVLTCLDSNITIKISLCF
jgi:hypothetical protein